MKKQTMKRIFTVILAVCMLLSIAPVTMAADTADDGYQKGEIIEFGSYPQSKVTDDSIISALNNILTDDMWVSYGYYIGTDTAYDGNMTSYDYMKYADLELNGEKYRAVRFSQYRPELTSSTSSETNSMQDNNGYYLNTTYFFKYEPLTWTVLDPEEGFVIAEKSIDAQAYENYSYYVNSESEEWVYNGKDCKYLANDWSKCSLREWLNKDFFNTAFTAEEKAQIGKSYLNNNSTYDPSLDGAGTFDKIFTISILDAMNGDYGFDTGASNSDFARIKPATDYAMCQGAEVTDTDGTVLYWWLRTAGFYSAFAFGVSSGGVIAGSGNSGQYSVNNTNMGVVPAFKFNPKTPTLAKGSKIEFGSYPQSEVTDADEVAKLEADSENYLWVSYKYYSGTGDRTDGKMESGDFMLYKDFYSDGEMFRAVTFSEYRPGSSGGLKGDVYSNQNDNGYHPNNVYYFKYEPLTWRVLDPDEGYIMCDNAIDSQAFQNFVIKKDDKLYNSKDFTNYVSDWETSSLRQWLNKTFYNTAFSREEKMLIGTTFLENNSTYGELVQDDSIDTVTLGAVWRDTEKPVIIGLENGKIYCGPQKFKVTDNDTSRTAIVIINGKNVEPDADGYYTAEPANGEFKIIAVDSFANMAMVQITVNAAHDYSDWKFDENEHWKECKYGDSVIEKGEHTFEWVTDKEATETEKGIAHEECTVCHAKRNENTEVQKLKTKWEKIRDWLISILVKIIKWFIDLIKDVC